MVFLFFMLEAQYQNGIELGQRDGWIIKESGLYSLMLRSKLPQALRKHVDEEDKLCTQIEYAGQKRE